MTEQELFWAGEFGDAYNERNTGERFQPARRAMFARILSKTPGIRSVLELGCNTGGNLLAIADLLPDVRLEGVEINAGAVARLHDDFAARHMAPVVHVGSLLETECVPADLTMAVGVLIHIHPHELPEAYRRLYELSNQYILVAEYYDPNPTEILYRGHRGRLWKRDFAGEMLDTYELRLLDYGFVYHRDVFPQDDVTWFLMEKVR